LKGVYTSVTLNLFEAFLQPPIKKELLVVDLLEHELQVGVISNLNLMIVGQKNISPYTRHNKSMMSSLSEDSR
jgi:hypothetical protein